MKTTLKITATAITLAALVVVVIGTMADFSMTGLMISSFTGYSAGKIAGWIWL